MAPRIRREAEQRSEEREVEPAPAPRTPIAHITSLQQSAGNAAVTAFLARQEATATGESTALAEFRRLLDDGDEEGAIGKAAALTEDEAGRALADGSLRSLAVSTFDDEEMARAMTSMRGGTLLQKLNWMSVEGSSLGLVWPLITRTDVPAAHKTELYSHNYVRDFFVDMCDNEEMASVVGVLGGTLEQKLNWMLVEGSSWDAVRPLLADPAVPADEKTALYSKNYMRSLFSELLGDEEMAEAVRLLGGTLEQKLNWMFVEGTSWAAVRPLIADETVPAAEKVALYPKTYMRDFFVDLIGDEEMAEVVRLLGGTLLQQLNWMVAEGTNGDLVFATIGRHPANELLTPPLPDWLDEGLRSELSGSQYHRAVRMLTSDVLNSAEVDESRTEAHYELKDPNDASQGYALQDFLVHGKYEIVYTRSELRIKVRVGFTGLTPTPAHLAIWTNGITSKWNGKYHIENGRRLAVVFEPIFGSPNAHHSIELHAPPVVREDAANWYAGPNANPTGTTKDTTDADTAAHEFGHLIGMADEYNLTAADYERFTGSAPTGPMPASGHDTTSVMAVITGPVEGRHIAPFVAWLNANRLPGETPYRLVGGA